MRRPSTVFDKPKFGDLVILWSPLRDTNEFRSHSHDIMTSLYAENVTTQTFHHSTYARACAHISIETWMCSHEQRVQTSAMVVNKLCHFLDRKKVVGGMMLRREVAGSSVPMSVALHLVRELL